MWNENVCRLCLSEKNLFCVLEKRENQIDNLEHIILITTGVEILENDVVSRKICENCQKVTVKILEFRERSLKTDRYLKDRYAEYLKQLEVKSSDKIVAPTDNSIATTSLQNQDVSKPNKTQSQSKLHLHQKIMTMNPTVTNIFTLNPTIKLPSKVLTFNVDPSVWMELDAVENYFIRNKLDMKKAVQTALKSSKVYKKTSISNKQKEILPNKVVSPISIKLSDINSKFPIISKDTLKRKICEKDETAKCDNPSKIKKRRLTSSHFRFDNKTVPPTLLDTLQLKPKENLHVCLVCHSVQNCPNSLRRHIREHFRCNFCNNKFKQHLRKEEHEKTCVVKHMLASEVYVRLEKIDADPETMKKYTAIDKTTEEETTKSSCTEIIELSDDDDDDDDQKTDTSDHKSNAQLESSTKTTVPYFSTALVRPDIKIKDDNVFNSVDTSTSDLSVLKQLLKINLTSDLKISIQEQTQTESACNENIVKVPDADTVTLKGLKPQLFAFKVPVRIQKGVFDVSYVTEKTPSTQKHMNLWSDIEPIRLKPIKSNNTQQLPIQLPGTIVQNPVNRINSGTDIMKLNSVPEIRTKPAQKPVQIILNQFISPSISNSFTGSTATGTNNVRASIQTTSTGVMKPHIFCSPPLVGNNTPHTYFKPNQISRTSTSIISTGQQQVFVPNNSGYNSLIVGTNHVSTPSTVTSVPNNNNGTNIYSTNYNVPNDVSLNYAINNKFQTLTGSAVPMNVNSQPSNSTALPHNFISQQRQSLNSTVVTSNSISQRRLSPNGIAVQLNLNNQPGQSTSSQQNNFCKGTGSVVENKIPNTNCNIGTNSLPNLECSASGQNCLPSKYNVFTDNGTIRPMIRVKNICELK